ncbi:MAG: lamin tail domain-containing protein, partial [Bacteroidota bacterium]|nr:lamin tail domain-containing protein [Bacteroidota bacterium]
MTFSLVFVLTVALVAVPAFAQIAIVSGNLNTSADVTGGSATPGDADAALQTNSFVVLEMPGQTGDAAVNGLVEGNVIEVTAAAGQFPNIKELLDAGGTIELLLKQGEGLTGTPAKANEESKLLHRLAISEILWGEDDGVAGDPRALPQWIEIYNEGGALVQGDDLRLLFTSNQRQERDKVTFKVATAGDNVGAGTYDAGTNTADTTYTVVDRVSKINRFGIGWALKGQSGRVTVPSPNPDAIAQVNLISMYRKRSTASNTAYKYKDGKPDGDKFADGTDGGQWIASVGRLNVSGPHIATPGAVQQNAGGLATQTKDPAALPVGSVIINEIYNSSTLRWIELHNTGSAEVNVKKYRMHAVHGAKKQDVVFSIPDKDAKIPAGGFLVVTNRQPADSILAGGVDLHDNNKFPAGASQLYVVTDVNMPAKGFLLVLRNGNDKDNHEKIVDIAGSDFVTDANFSDVWPLKGWTVPGDIDFADFGDKSDATDSLQQNTGKTYARIEQKSGGNRLHKDHWRMDGPMDGLGYDPGVDVAIAPGTPGYANNAKKDKPADIIGEVVISEIMYDAGANGNLVQWIELYNSSMTRSANLNGWEFEVRNIDTDVESYVDAKFKFDGDAVILPNQTLLLVSDRSSASDVVSNRVYNLYQKHRSDLGLSARKSILLSSEGFHLQINDKDGNLVDEAGNVMLDGPRRSVEWALPESGGDMRHSIVRGFGTRAFDGTADMANDGTMMSSWIVAESVGSYYGHRDDVGSPGHREGSPLPVSLSSFRPVRNAETGAVVITWVTESELNNAGFNILRSETKDGAFQVINVKGIIAGHGTTSEKHVYTYTDTTAKPNVVYYYQIEDVSLDGERTTLRTTHLR